MSISLPNGTLLAAPASQVQYTAAVTRILHLTNFSKELKTRDLQTMFKDWEGDKGGFRIKWVDDVNALIVFADAGIAKRAYLHFLLRPPANFSPPAQIKPYDRPDAGQIIAALSARAMGHRASMSSAVMNSGAFNGNAGHTGPGAIGNGIDGLPSSYAHTRASSISAGQGHAGAGGNSSMGSFSFPKTRASISGNPFSAGSSQIGAVGTNGGVGMGMGMGQGRHNRTGSSSSTAAFSRSGGTGGALNFGGGPSSTASGVSSGTSTGGIPFAARLPTHTESLDSPAVPTAPYPSRRTTRQNAADLERVTSMSASSSDNEPVVVMDHAPTPTPAGASAARGGYANGGGGGGGEGFKQWKMPSTGGSSGMIGTGGSRRDSVSAEKALREVEKALASVEAQ